MEIQLGHITSDAIYNQINFKLSHWSYDIITNALFQEIVEFSKNLYKGSPEQQFDFKDVKSKVFDSSMCLCKQGQKKHKQSVNVLCLLSRLPWIICFWSVLMVYDCFLVDIQMSSSLHILWTDIDKDPVRVTAACFGEICRFATFFYPILHCKDNIVNEHVHV